MKNDNPDTFPEAEQTRWMETHAEDVFLPSVRVQLHWHDVESAVGQGGIVATQAHAMWATWAMPGSPTRMGSEDSPVSESQPASLESTWSKRPMPPARQARRSGGGWWFLTGLVAGAAAVWVYASVRGISLLG